MQNFETNDSCFCEKGGFLTKYGHESTLNKWFCASDRREELNSEYVPKFSAMLCVNGVIGGRK